MRIKHGRVELELHELSAGREHGAVLLLHALCGSSADWAEAPAMWPGPVYGLDFSGHGRSNRVLGGAYYAELLAADADAALARIGPAAIAGAGFGAYAALLVAGARPDLVPAVLLLPGAGLDGGGPQPNFGALPFLGKPDADAESAFDPMVRVLERDIRPPEYVEAVVRPIRHVLLLEDGGPRPPWWQAIGRIPAAERLSGDVPAAFARLRALVSA